MSTNMELSRYMLMRLLVDFVDKQLMKRLLGFKKEYFSNEATLLLPRYKF
jgi:hypothetical protein